MEIQWTVGHRMAKQPLSSPAVTILCRFIGLNPSDESHFCATKVSAPVGRQTHGLAVWADIKRYQISTSKVWIWDLLLTLIQHNPNALISTLSVFFGVQELLTFLDLAWPNTTQANSQSDKKTNFCSLSYFLKCEDILKVPAVRSGLDMMMFKSKWVFSKNTVCGAKWNTQEPAVHTVRLRPEAGQDKYGAQLFCMFFSHILGCPLPLTRVYSGRKEEMPCRKWYKSIMSMFGFQRKSFPRAIFVGEHFLSFHWPFTRNPWERSI